MVLSDEQKKSVALWVENGLGLSDIQKRIKDEFDITMTYMDVRFLVLDLGVDVRDKDVHRPSPSDALHESPPRPPDPAQEDRDAGLPGEYPGDDAVPGASQVSVDVDRIVKLGALVSGSVVFSDGQKAAWSLDQTGRLMLEADVENYRPSEQDVHAFQMELRKAIEKRGF
ncbi:MAG: hypothetical protein O3C57_05375 [Verrucomicrobia bacterium]|nr:hypothetical protein [Verrucomicrobiota bacterium]